MPSPVEIAIARAEMAAIEPPPPFLYLRKDATGVAPAIGRALSTPRAPTLSLFELTDPSDHLDLAATARTIAEIVPADAIAIENPLVGAASWSEAVAAADVDGTVLVLSPPDPREIDVLDLAKAVRALAHARAIVDVPDDDAARAGLAGLAALFKVATAPSRLFATTFEVTHTAACPVAGDAAHHAAVARMRKLTDRPFERTIPILKTDEERFVLGVVLEPETVDAQDDVYSSEEIRAAAHHFLEEYRNVGIQHQALVNGRVKIVESYLSPIDFVLGAEHVKRGTWLLGVRVVDDALWAAVKSGDIGGFSIGGFARRVPET